METNQQLIGIKEARTQVSCVISDDFSEAALPQETRLEKGALLCYVFFLFFSFFLGGGLWSIEQLPYEGTQVPLPSVKMDCR